MIHMIQELFGQTLRFANSQESRSARPVAAAGVGFALPQSAYHSVGVRLPAIYLPVANAMNEKQHGRSIHRSGIQD